MRFNFGSICHVEIQIIGAAEKHHQQKTAEGN
jgi:hypothetical protein